VLELKSPWRDGTTHIVMWPLECMQRLAALVPRVQPHPIRLHGALVPYADLRAQIVPSVPASVPQRYTDHDRAAHPDAPGRMSWACLLKRVFGTDVERCPRCAGRFKIIAAIVDPRVVVQILTHVGLPATPSGAAVAAVPSSLTLYTASAASMPQSAGGLVPRWRKRRNAPAHRRAWLMNRPSQARKTVSAAPPLGVDRPMAPG